MYLFLFLCILPLINSIMYNNNTAEIGVWLSAATYCDRQNYSTMVLSGPATGFQYYSTLYDIKTATQGYMGVYLPKKQIYIIFRGSSFTRNWIDNSMIRLIPYNTFPDCNCTVHSGFYKSVENIYPSVYSFIQKLLHLYPSYEVIVTGHSYGAAIAQLIGMELFKNNITSIVYNYGQPRVGNKDYANFVNANLLIWRFTHYKDMVPHIPPIDFGYYHSVIEVYQDNENNYYICTDGEDSNCADQFKLYQTNGVDHNIYLNHVMDCSTSTK